MELKKFKKNKTYKKTLLALGIAGMCLGGGIILSKSYALYETKKEYNVIKGTVPDFGYDVKLAVTVDGVKKEEMPTSPMSQDGKYYEVKVSCGSSKTEGLWDYNAWRLNLDYIESNSKCNLEFTSSMTKDQYDEYIKSGVALRRNTYRGKNITDLWRNGKLYEQIEDGTFADIYVGDYIVSENTDESSKKIVWLIADIDNYMLKKDLSQHHITIISKNNLMNAKMNSDATTDGGYQGSEMFKNVLGLELTQDENTVLGKYIYPDFKDHILQYRNALSNLVNEGSSSGFSWINRYLDLMSEVNVLGTVMWSPNGYDVGIDSQQYAIFRLKPEFINDTTNTSASYWLRNVASDKQFGYISYDGLNLTFNANTEYGVRPRFLIY